jgi:hypothetical protein
MRVVALLLVFAGACSGLDNFGQFTFNAQDMTVAADAGGAAFGAACTANECMQYNGMRPVSCITTMGAQTFPDGMCTRTCTLGAMTGACNDLPGADCEAVGLVGYCLPKCTGGGTACRNGYNCCASGAKVANGAAGWCTPESACP